MVDKNSFKTTSRTPAFIFLNVTGHIAGLERLQNYQSYGAAWWAPIFYPLSLALLAQAIIYGDMVKHRLTGKPLLPAIKTAHTQMAPRAHISAEVPVLLLMSCETIFGIFCIVQCIINRGGRKYMGGADACELQTVYCARSRAKRS